MKHPFTRRLFSYWNERRGTRSAPERSEIDPAAIPPLLADSFVLSFNPELDHPFRLAGTRLCSMFGRELKDAPFLGLWDAGDQPRMRELVTIVAEETTGAVAACSGTTDDNERIDFELILLPLRHHGDRRARMLGMLAQYALPGPLGRHPVGTLALGTVRHLDPTTEIHAAPALRLVSGRGRGNLRVYQGGRA